jgi:DNA-binding MarR family transcriptional regulator
MTNTQGIHPPPWRVRHLFEERIKTLSGSEDISGLEIASTIAILANFYDAYASQIDEHSNITGPRWMLLMGLLDEETRGNSDGITPTMLSQARNVSKNTTSSLLRGLEELGLIERNLDKNDRRFFRIRLTDKGRTLTKKISPKRFSGLNKLAGGLKKQEREQLIILLGKLIDSMFANGHFPTLSF